MAESLAPEAGSAPLRSRWRLLRHELLYLVWALIEIALITPVALAFMPWARLWPPGLVALWLLLLLYIPFNLSRLMSLLEVAIDRQRVIMALSLTLTVLLSWRALLYQPTSLLDFGWLSQFLTFAGSTGNPLWVRNLTLFLLTALMWWRGISLVGRRVDIADVGTRFRLGLLYAAVVIGGLAASQLPWPVTPFILLFFFAALLSIVLTRVEQLELSRSGSSFPLTLRWILVVTVAAFLIVFVVGILAGLASGEPVGTLMGSLGPLWTALRFLAIAVVATVSLMSTPLLLLMSWILGLLTAAFSPALEQAANNLELNLPPPVLTPTDEELDRLNVRFNLIPGQWLAILAMVAVVLIVSLFLGRMILMMRREAQLEREFVMPGAGEGPSLPSSLGQRLLDRLRSLGRWRTAASIRRIYREMSQAAANYGYPRQTWETPYEYLPTLAQAWPEHTAETSLITEAYNRVRYGEIPESPDELAAIVSAWETLQKAKPLERASNLEDTEVRIHR